MEGKMEIRGMILTLLLIFQCWIGGGHSWGLPNSPLQFTKTSLLFQRVLPSTIRQRRNSNNHVSSRNFRTGRLWANSSSVVGEEEYDDLPHGNANRLRQEAETLKAKALQLKAEAAAMEAAIESTRSKQINDKTREKDELVNYLFPRLFSEGSKKSINLDPDQVVDRLEERRWTGNQIELVVDRLFEKQLEALGQKISSTSETDFRQSTTTTSNDDGIVGTVTSSVPVNETEYERLADVLDCLLTATSIVDERTSSYRDVGISDSRNINKNNDNKWKRTSRRRKAANNLRGDQQPLQLETTARSRLRELQRRQQMDFDRKRAAAISAVVAEVNRVMSNANRSISDGVIEIGSGSTNDSDFQWDASSLSSPSSSSSGQESVSLLPLWVPASFLPLILSSPVSSLDKKLIDEVKDKVMTGSQFYVTSSDSVPGAAVFRGNIRTPKGAVYRDKFGNNNNDNNNGDKLQTKNNNKYNNSTAIVFQSLQERLSLHGLDKKVRLFFLPDPEWNPRKDEKETEAKPVILALPKTITPDESKSQMGKIASATQLSVYWLATVSTFLYGIQCYALNETFFASIVNFNNLSIVPICLPLCIGVMCIHIFHEIAHRVVAKRRGIQLGTPVPIPSPILGILGCITPLKSFPSKRSSLFDVAMAGPFASLVLSLMCIVTGFKLSTRASSLTISRFPVIDAAIFKSSFLIGTLSSWLSSKLLMLPMAQPVSIHPLFLVGYSGLISSALNLLPVFRLDGGRACAAVVGQRQAVLVSVAVIFYLLSMVLSGNGSSSIGLSWLMIISIFQRRQEIQCQDDVTKVDNIRKGIWFLSIFLSLSILLPFPGGLSVL